MLKSLRRKIICITMVIVTVMLSCIFVTVYHFTQQNLRQESMRMMETMSKGPMRPSRPGSAPGELRLPYFILSMDGAGGVQAAEGVFYDLSDREFLEDAAKAALATEKAGGELDAYGLRFMRSMDPEGERIVFVDMSGEKAALNNLLETSLLIGLGSWAVLFVVSFFFARLAVKPVERAWEQQRQFVADASHELKTPLTVILTCTELMKSKGHSPEEKARFLESIQSMGCRMRGLTEALLELARMDAGSHSGRQERLELSELAAEELMVFEPLCFEQGLGIREDIERGLFVKGSPEELHRLLSILLDNAVKYSSPGGEIVLSLKKQGCFVHLRVENPGENISAEDLRNIFKRFYRLDRSRSGGSYGLGLSIAEGIVRSHRGKIWAESSDGVNRFNVMIPINKNP